MTDISPIGRPTSARLRTDNVSRSAVPNEVRESRGADRVELSGNARLLNKLHEMPEVRQDLIDRVRSEIQAGTYDSSEKIDALLESLAEDLA